MAEQTLRIGPPLLSADRHRGVVSAKNVLECFNLHVQRHSETDSDRLLVPGRRLIRYVHTAQSAADAVAVKGFLDKNFFLHIIHGNLRVLYTP